MQPRVILNKQHFELTVKRLAHQLIENHGDFKNTILIGLQPRGILLCDHIKDFLEQELEVKSIVSGYLDVTFYRDDFRRRDDMLQASQTIINFEIENKRVVLIDDVLYTGRTIRAGMDALMDFGRARSVELLVLIDRRFSRQLPIQPDYIGKTVDSVVSERVKVEWDNKGLGKQVLLFNAEEGNE